MTNSSINLQDNTGTPALTYGISSLINIKIVPF
jgi:hypothetical protein